MRYLFKFIYNFIYGCYLFLVFYSKNRKKLVHAELIFFFPFYHTGGAERVHSQIVSALREKKCIVIFTQGSATSNFLEKFEESAIVMEINKIVNKRNVLINKLLIYFLYSCINKSKTIQAVFSSNSTYFYKLLPHLKSDLKIVDLYHSFAPNDAREQQLIDSASRINIRIVISQKAKIDLINYYDKNKLDGTLISRIEVVENAVVIPDTSFHKNNTQLIIGFVGRWSEEKRPLVYLKIATKIKSKFPNVKFVMAGSGMVSNIEIIQNSGVEYMGDLFEEQKIAALYNKLDLLLMPSIYEGFPMVIMEAMSNGVIPIVTNVGGISEHLTNGENGILIAEEIESKIIEAFSNSIIQLIEDANRRNNLAQNCFSYAHENFGIDKFNNSYRELVN